MPSSSRLDALLGALALVTCHLAVAAPCPVAAEGRLHQSSSLANPVIQSLGASPVATDEGAGVDFDAVVADPNPGTLVYLWDFGDGSPPVQGVGAARVVHRFRNGAQGGSTYTVTLTVTDPGGGSDRATTSVSVANVAPRILTMQRNGPGVVASPVAFIGHATDPGPDDALRYTWDFGDGVMGSGPQVQHAYATPGRYTVTLAVDDVDGGVDRRTLEVTVGDEGKLSVNGAVGIPAQDLTNSLLSAVPIGGGRCELRLQLAVDGDAGIGFQVVLPGGLAEGFYRVGPTSQDAGMWDDELASPGIFTATAALDPAYDPPERALFGFWSTEGTFRVEHFDGERLEASFSVELRERTVNSATPPPYFIDVEGWVAQAVGRNVLGGVPTSGAGGFYLCDVGASPMVVADSGPPDHAINVHPTEPPIRLLFGTAIDPTTLHDGTFLLQYRLPDLVGSAEARFASVPGAWASTGDGGFQFTPTTPLLDGVQYQAVVRGGPDGVRGVSGEQLERNVSWFFTTLVQPRVRVTVDQGGDGGTLEPGRPVRTRVYVDWDEKPDVHPTWQAPAFPARVEVSVNGSPVEAYPPRDVPLTRPDRLRARDGEAAQIAVDFEGWVPTTPGPVTVTATVEPLMQEVSIPQRFESPPFQVRVGGGPGSR